MSDARETLEQLRKRVLWSPGYISKPDCDALSDAIREVLDELGDTNEALAACQASGGWLKAEVERLRAHRDRLLAEIAMARGGEVTPAQVQREREEVERKIQDGIL